MSKKNNTEPIYKNLYNDTNFKNLIDKINAGEKALSLCGLSGSSKYYLVSAIYELTKRPFLFLSPNKKRAQSTASNLSFFLNETVPVLEKKEPGVGEALYSSKSQFLKERNNWLYSAMKGKPVIAEVQALFESAVPKKSFEGLILKVSKGDLLLSEDITTQLLQTGYVRTDFVQGRGDISARGSIIDIFSPGHVNPVRLEFIGDEVGSIREFSIEDQKSTEKIDHTTILPVSTISMDQSSIKRALEYLRKRAEEQGIPARNKHQIIEQIEKGERIPNMEWMVQAFYPKLGSIFDYLPPDVLIFEDEPEENISAAESFLDSLSETESILKKRLKIAPDIQEIYFTNGYIKKKTRALPNILLRDLEIDSDNNLSFKFKTDPITNVQSNEADSPIDTLAEKIDESQQEGYTLILAFKSQNEEEKILDLLKGRGYNNIVSKIGSLSNGFKFQQAKLEILTEEEIFGEKKDRTSYKKGKNVPSAFITSFSELKPGDYIVHIEFGIGIFRNLKKLNIGGTEGDYIQCEYAGGDKIYVPVDKLKLVQRYIGDGKPHKVDRLGNQSWNTRVKKVRKAVESVAGELLELYARRKAEKGFQYSKRDETYREFELEFGYEETPDQEAAIEDVMQDMESSKPMDRLICGDVGFGKTEVALRAAFKAAMDGKQVAFLVPTTLLADQHHKTALNRLKSYPMNIDAISRFNTGKQEKETIEKLEDGSIDIIIGTHKLLNDKIKFKDLGLLIIDEEHRFGVTQKEKLKKLKNGVDVLSLSATPIPRTLQLSLAKIRDISLITTAPEGRQSIETHVYKSNPNIIVEAVSKEIKRGGAVFFIHNRIKDIYRVADQVHELVPYARIEVTHGRMREKPLEDSIERFIKGEIDILVTTAIVESGLDIPRANTIVIDEANTFGLADLYQLRGRVGRSDEKAYAYLLIPNTKPLTDEAKRRLKVISEFKELGSGFKLALSDLEIRGAGHLFGNEQSGHIADVGLEMYLDMLEGAVKRLQGEIQQEEAEPEISLSMSALIPDDYISNDTERLLTYKRLSSLSKKEDILDLRVELEDRFGDIPEATSNLIELMNLKLLMKGLNIQKAEIREKRTVIIFSENSNFYTSFPPKGKMEIFYESEDSINETKNILKDLRKLEKSKGKAQ
ncbi:MAG: transcription-repair-coupling factor [Thermodesulfobacteriota bacterium]|nr:MAG: transcription-repair-coupling factor [Thermodesulfobacteriota bacterium]